MAAGGGANLWVVSMHNGQAAAMACRPSPSRSFLLHRAPPGLSVVASPSPRFIGILSSPRARTLLNVLAIHAQDPDFYKIPYVEGIPVGKRLKLWNLPPNCKRSELLEWFEGIDVKVESLEFTDDPALNAQGIGGFVEFATKQQACIAIVRLDGYKFRGHYIRMDFAEKRPHSRNYGSRRNRNWSSSGSQGNFGMSSRAPVTDMVPSISGSASPNAQFTPRYEAANSSSVQASSGYGISTQSANVPITSSHDGSSASSLLDVYHNSADNRRGIQYNPSYGNAQSPLDYSSTSPSDGYSTTQFPSEHGSASSSSLPGGNLSASSAAPPLNPQPPPSYGITPEKGDGSNKTAEYYSHPSLPAHGGIQSAPNYRNTSVSGSTQASPTEHIPSYGNNYAKHGSLQQYPKYDGRELNGQSATVPSTSSYDIGSQAPQYGNSSVQPLYSDGTVTGKSFKGGSGVDKFPTFSNNSQSLTSSYSTHPSSSTSVSNNQPNSAFGKSYGNSSHDHASPLGENTIRSGSSYGSVQDTADDNGVPHSYGNSCPPPVPQSSPSNRSVNTQSDLSYGNMGRQSSTFSTQSSFDSSQIPGKSSSSPDSVSTPPQPSYGETQPSSRSVTTQAAPSAYDGPKKSPVGAVSNSGRTSAVAQGHSPNSPNSSYSLVESYEDLLKNYGAPDAAEVEPWLANTGFRSGPMFGSPQPSSLHRLFVGNLASSIDDAALQELFSKFGTVLEARVLRDQESGRSRGFAVVAMSSVDEVKAASKALNGWQVESRSLKVDAVISKH